jgi:hypothetical protein
MFKINDRILDLLFSLETCQMCDIVAGDVALVIRLGGFCHPPVAICVTYYLQREARPKYLSSVHYFASCNAVLI